MTRAFMADRPGWLVSWLPGCLAAWLAMAGMASGCATTAPATARTSVMEPDEARPIPRPPPRQTLRITAAGDVMFGRYRNKVYRPSGGDAPFAYVATRWRDSDLVFINLETPLMDGMPERFQRGKWDRRNLSFRADTSYARMMKEAGIDVVSLANNHAEDCRKPGIASTIEALDRAGIVHFGTSVDGDAYAPRVLELDGVEIVFMGLTLHRNKGELRAGERAQLAYLPRTLATPWVPEKVRAVRARHPDALIIFSFHWGVEYEHDPYFGIRQIARSAIESGADLVLGHHPHVLQPVEAYRDGLILYSMGNLVFDMIRAQPQRSALFHIDLARDESGRWRPNALRVEPVHVRPGTGPRAPQRQLGRAIARDLATWSRKYKTALEFESDGQLWWRRPAPRAHDDHGQRTRRASDQASDQARGE